MTALPAPGTTVRVLDDAPSAYRRMTGKVEHVGGGEYPVLVDFGRDAMLRDLPERELFAADEIEVAS